MNNLAANRTVLFVGYKLLLTILYMQVQNIECRIWILNRKIHFLLCKLATITFTKHSFINSHYYLIATSTSVFQMAARVEHISWYHLGHTLHYWFPLSQNSPYSSVMICLAVKTVRPGDEFPAS
jgi:hypothetical protein